MVGGARWEHEKREQETAGSAPACSDRSHSRRRRSLLHPSSRQHPERGRRERKGTHARKDSSPALPHTSDREPVEFQSTVPGGFPQSVPSELKDEETTDYRAGASLRGPPVEYEEPKATLLQVEVVTVLEPLEARSNPIDFLLVAFSLKRADAETPPSGLCRWTVCTVYLDPRLSVYPLCMKAATSASQSLAHTHFSGSTSMGAPDKLRVLRRDCPRSYLCGKRDRMIVTTGDLVHGGFGKVASVDLHWLPGHLKFPAESELSIHSFSIRIDLAGVRQKQGMRLANTGTNNSDVSERSQDDRLNVSRLCASCGREKKRGRRVTS